MFRRGAFVAALVFSLIVPGIGFSQASPQNATQMVQLDFRDVELTVIVDTIAKLTGKNFIYDDRVRGRVTIISPTPVTVEQAYAVFESVLKVKGFTAVPGPGQVMKIIPVRDAKESSIETVKDNRRSPNRDTFVTRLIPLLYISAEAITATIKPLVSKDASMVAYAPTNTIILTDTSANIRRLLSILDAIDVETHKEELAVIQVEHADAATLGQQLSEIYDAEVSQSSATPARRPRGRRTPAKAAAAAKSASKGGGVRIITDDRTNSLLVLAARSQLEDIRGLVRKLDVPVVGGGRIHVYYLTHADAEELAQTHSARLSGQRGGAGGAGGAQPQQLRSAVTALSEGISVTADPQTNALLIQASREAYETLKEVIEKLDRSRPQVLVEALIMEVDLRDGLALGMSWAIEIINGNYTLAFSSMTDSLISSTIDSAADSGASGAAALGPIGAAPLAASVVKRHGTDQNGDPTGTAIAGVIRAAANDDRINILSAPHILTSDNEEAEIKIGNNIPIITSRVNSATGNVSGLATSVNVERQDIGVTLRVTPQISEGDTLRLKIFQEITDVNDTLSETTGSAEDVGVALLSRRIENTVVVADGETVIIGGLIGEVSEDNEVKVPFFGDIPFFGWAFKTVERRIRKENLLVFLTPHIVRDPQHLEAETIKRRERFLTHTEMLFDETELEEEADYVSGTRGVRHNLRLHSQQYPLERMAEIEMAHLAEQDREEAALERAEVTRYGLRAGLYSDEDTAAAALTDVLDRGFDATLVATEADGVIFYEVQVGPYETIQRAEDVSVVLERGLGLHPSISVMTVATP